MPIAKESKDELESCADTADQLVGSEGNGYIWTIWFYGTLGLVQTSIFSFSEPAANELKS